MDQQKPYEPAENAQIHIEKFSNSQNWFVSIDVKQGHKVCVAILGKYELLKALQDNMDVKELKLFLDAIHNPVEEEE